MCYDKNKKGGKLMPDRMKLRSFIEANYQPPALREYAPSMLQEKACVPMAAPKARKKPPVSLGLGEWLQKADAGFSETLLKLIDRTGKKDSEIYGKANLSRQHFSKIRNNPGYRPTKATALALAVALELNLDETRDLIGRAGYALTNSSIADLIVMFFIQEGCYDLNEINEALYEYDQNLLGM
jgi:hypothetical protein